MIRNLVALAILLMIVNGASHVQEGKEIHPWKRR